MTPLPCACLCLVLTGCASFPEVDAAAEARLTNPSLAPMIAPIDAVRAQAAEIVITDETTTGLQTRAAGLQERGAGLQGPVGDAETVARLTAALPGAQAVP